ncbi:MAG: Ig-like domain-containing protein, partial [Tannerella sp.]|nr:Ig-like domain-containing protein [Tannerella sp.]
MKIFVNIFLILLCACGGERSTNPPSGSFQLTNISIGGANNQSSYTDVSPDLNILLTFSEKAAAGSVQSNIVLKKGAEAVPVNIDCSNNPILTVTATLTQFAQYELIVNSGLKSETGAAIATGKTFSLKTGMNTTDKFPRIPDEELLDLVQRQTFRYFWEFGHPVSGMARERTTSNHTVTSGGTGFGLMATVVAVERGFITREQ